MIRNFLLVLALVALAAAASATEAGEQDARKARYVFYQATAEREMGNFDSFFDLIEYAHRLDSTNTSIGFYYGVAILTMDNASEAASNRAVELMRRHVEAFPADYNESSYYYRALWSKGRYSEAKEIAQRQVKLFPTKDEPLQRLALCYAHDQQYDSVIAVYNRLERSLGVNENITSIKASTHEVMGDSAAALDDWRALRRAAPLDVSANTMLANAFLERDMNDSAKFYLDHALEIDPYDGFSNFSMAQYFEAIGDTVGYEKATYRTLTECDFDIEMKLRILQRYSALRIIEDDTTGRSDALFKRMLELHPMEVSLRMLYFSYLSATARDAEAFDQVDVCLDLEPSNSELWERAISLAYVAGDYERANKYIERAREMNSDDSELLTFIATAYMSMKEYDKALGIYDDLLPLSGEDAEQQSNLLGGKGDVYNAMGDIDNAVAAYERALELYPGNVGFMNNYAYCLACNNRDMDRALELIARACTAEPDNYNYLDTYAWVYYKRGENVMALFYIELALKAVDDPNAEIIEHYGDILKANKRDDEARAQWQRALEKVDDTTAEDGMRQRLEEKLNND